MFKMNKQKLQSNLFQRKFGHIKKKYEIDDNNNNSNIKRASDGWIQRHKPNGVQKGKLKTLAQDRLMKIVKNGPAAVADLLKNPAIDFKPAAKELLPKSYSSNATVIKSDDSLKSTVSGLEVKGTKDVKSVRSVGNTVKIAPVSEEIKTKWPKDFAPNEVANKIESTTASDVPKSSVPRQPWLHPSAGSGLHEYQTKLLCSDIVKQGHAAQVQNRLKINDHSKIIGVKKLKLKTPAQDRLQRLVNKNKAALVESWNELVDADVDMIVPDSKSQRKSIGIQKSHVTGTEPSIIDIMNKSGTVNECKLDVTTGAATDTTASAAAAVAVTAPAAYIIPDTNVFLNSLACIKNVIDRGLKHIILVPFVVLQELDGLKQRRGEQNFTVKFNAKRAIRFIYELSLTDNKRLQGQSAIEDKNHLIDIKSNDDKILNCCLQLVEQSKKVILVTNDLNLTNTAKFSDIETITQKRCMEIVS